MKKPTPFSLYQFFKIIPDEEAARQYFEKHRWEGNPFCPHCASIDVRECKDHSPMPYRCRDCRKHFSVRTGTVLASSRIPLKKWLIAIYMMTTARKGIPSTQLAKELGITQKSAWFLAQRIRETWAAPEGPLGTWVQVDEVYIGGKEKNRHESKKLRPGGGASGKQAVIGIRDETGRVVAKPIPNTTSQTLQGYIKEHVPAGAVVVTDEYRGYKSLKDYVHLTVKHSIKEYVRDQAHTNGIESFWALLKRGYHGIYHHMSYKHLHRYVNEFAFRHNTAEVGTLPFIGLTIRRMERCHLSYEDLIA